MSDAITANIGILIRERRKLRGMDQWELGARIGVTQSTVSLIEGGVIAVDLPKYLAICEALNTHPEEMLWGARTGAELRVLIAQLTRSAQRSTPTP